MTEEVFIIAEKNNLNNFSNFGATPEIFKFTKDAIFRRLLLEYNPILKDIIDSYYEEFSEDNYFAPRDIWGTKLGKAIDKVSKEKFITFNSKEDYLKYKTIEEKKNNAT